VPGYQFARRKGPYQAVARLHDLLAEGNEHPAVKNQAARLWTAIGLGHYRQQPGFTDGDPGLNYYPQDRHLTAAQDSWRRAMELTPGRRDSAFYLGLVEARIDRGHPERVEAAFGPMVSGLSDQILLGDILNTVANAYLEDGQVMEARRRYAHSYDVFCLPKVINFEAQKQLGGM
jgi:hypothetical protein